MSTFGPEVVTAVCAHMNGDHSEDNLRIVQAFGRPEATAAIMSDLDGTVGIWMATIDGVDEEVRIGWPAGPITERAEIRREVVALYERACAELGVQPAAH